MDGIVVVNGVFCEPESASIPALDRGFLFGDNVFEVFVGFYDKVLDLKRHLKRLRESAEQLEISIPWSDDELAFELNSVAERLSLPKIYLRLVITRGIGSGLEVPQNCKANKIIYAFPAKQVPANIFKNGLKLQLCHLPYTERGPMAKTGNYLRSILAIKKAQKANFDDILWANTEGEITESSTANIFFLGREGDLLEVQTPNVDSGILKGITRETMIGLLEKSKIPVHQVSIDYNELARFDEAFVCSTVKGLIPVASIGEHKFHTLRDNNTYRHFYQLFQTWIATELGHYVDWNTGAKIK